MMKITIETVFKADSEMRYDRERQEYCQTVETLDVAAVIAVVNGLSRDASLDMLPRR